MRLIVCLLLFILMSGCVHQQYVSEPYPRWGEEHTIQRPDDNSPIILRVLSPQDAEQTRACVLIVHGMNEHIGRYRNVARYFSRQFMVTGFDFYAHGLSNPVLQQADRALLTGAGQQDVSSAYLEQAALYDLEPLRRDFNLALKKTVELCERQGGANKPVFIIAHSLGGLITASYLIQQHNGTDTMDSIVGVVLLAPGFAVSEPPGWRGWVANPMIKLSFHAETHFLNPQDEPLPFMLLNQILSLVTVPLFDGLFEVLSWPGLRHFLSPPSPQWVTDYLTDSEAEKRLLRADGWIVRRTLLRYVKGIEGEIVQFRRQMDQFDWPYFLVYSEQDPITPAWGSEDFLDVTMNNHPANDMLVLPNLVYHQHLFLAEPLRTQVLESIEHWLDHRLQVMRQGRE